MDEPQELLHGIAQAIYDKKGSNILGLDVRNLSSLTEYFLIAEGTVPRHVTALAKHIVEIMKEKGVQPLHCEGVENGDWIVVDYGEIIIHLFLPDMRHRYALEELWREADIVDVEIVIDGEENV